MLLILIPFLGFKPARFLGQQRLITFLPVCKRLVFLLSRQRVTRCTYTNTSISLLMEPQ